MSPNNKGDLAAPRVDKTGPAGVKYDVLSVSGAEADGRVVKGLPGVLEDCRENSKDQITTSENFQANTGNSLSWSKKVCALTLSVNTQHDRSVVGMQMKEDRCADQVLGEIPEERNRPEMNQYQRVSSFYVFVW